VCALVEDLTHFYKLDLVELKSPSFWDALMSSIMRRDGVGLTAGDDLALSLCFCDSCLARAARPALTLKRPDRRALDRRGMRAGDAETATIEFRVGIHVGDVVEESDGDLMGDGVNIAARLEGIAEPGTICLSEDAYRQVKSRLDLKVSDLGAAQLKNKVASRVSHVVSGRPARCRPVCASL
jgi:class 3 adenylate cyclase